MQDMKHGRGLRIGLGVLALIILLFTIPAYLDPASNPGLAILTGEAATLGSVAGMFLGRQLSLALIAAWGVYKGTTQPMLIGGFAIAFFNLHDAVMLLAAGNMGPGAIAGIVLGLAGVVVMVMTNRAAKATAA